MLSTCVFNLRYMPSAAKRQNRLEGEHSTYLSHAANQRVDWFPWCDEAFSRAREQKKPILLDIGASWCHWCHVMDDGTYEHESVAERINRHFVAIKVDRDERPDIDARYQKAVNAMTGQGGWPLTVFMDDDGRPFYGGTYFPPESSGGMPGFLEVLDKVSSYYSESGSDAREVGRRVAAAIMEDKAQPPGDVKSSVVSAALHRMVEEADAANGGFGHAPKFPHTAAMEFLMAQMSRGETEAVPVILMTLNRMQSGGIHDQIGGGFHRYSTDHAWIVPHFEKMTYDNAGLIRNYLHGYQIFHDEEYRKTADGIAAFFVNTLYGDNGFFASQDADAFPGDDGDFWTWTPAELSEAATGREREAAALHFHIRGAAEMHGRRDRHVLYRAMDAVEVAESMSLGKDETQKLISSAMEKMLEARKRRPVPSVDRTVYSNWNGMAISSLYEYARTFLNEDIASKCRLAVDAALASSFDEEQGFLHTVGGNRAVHGLLEDQVHMGHALLDAFCYHGVPAYISAAKSVAEIIVLDYALPSGALNDIDRRVEAQKNTGLHSSDNVQLFDSPCASPNASASLFLQRIASITGDSTFDRHAAGILMYSVPRCAGSGTYAGAMFQAMDMQLNGIPQIVIAGDASSPGFMELRRAAGAAYLPGKEVICVDTTSSAAPQFSDTVNAMILKSASSGRAIAFLCTGKTCSAPADNATELLRRIHDAQSSRIPPFSNGGVKPHQ